MLKYSYQVKFVFCVNLFFLAPPSVFCVNPTLQANFYFYCEMYLNVILLDEEAFHLLVL